MEKIIFCKIKPGKYLRAIPTIETKAIILSSYWKDKEFGEDGYCTIFREPVVGINNIFCMPIKYEDGLSPYVIRVPIDITKAANGDYDGDDWAVIPYKDLNLTIDKHTIPAQQPDMTTIDINSQELKPKTKREMVNEAIAWRKEKIDSGKLTIKYGGVRKRAAFSQDSLKNQTKILMLANDLEVILKQEKHGGAWEDKINKNLQQLKQMIPQKIIKDKVYGEWNIHELLTGKSNSWFRLLGFTPGGFWLDIFNMPLTPTDRKLQQLKQNKRIII